MLAFRTLNNSSNAASSWSIPVTLAVNESLVVAPQPPAAKGTANGALGGKTESLLYRQTHPNSF
jgi:hypothetical protein